MILFTTIWISSTADTSYDFKCTVKKKYKWDIGYADLSGIQWWSLKHKNEYYIKNMTVVGIEHESVNNAVKKIINY